MLLLNVEAIEKRNRRTDEGRFSSRDPFFEMFRKGTI